MNRNFSLLWMIVATLIATAIAECPNACSAHGKCGAYDMCTCYRNWMSSDCSERICQFGLAHVDTPKGDLDASGGKLTGPDTLVAVNDFVYPYGTTEQYPSVKDIDDRIQQNTAHEYRECSNKGICDRTTGTCTCFEGYEGSACQRASCPTNANGVCSGHGTCQSISDIARNDYNNIYKLWDEDATMGCVCDGGYEGPDCSQRKCKYGTDPLYFDKNATIRYSNWTYGFHTQAGSAASNTFGNYSLIFYDSYGEDWQTDPIPITANCDQLTSILERLPNDVVPRNSVRCYKYQVSAGSTKLGDEDIANVQPAGPILDVDVYLVTQFIIAFTQNPGKLKQPEINIYLDGTRRTLYTNEVVSTLGWYLYPDGFHGEDVDYVPNRCAGVTAKITFAVAQSQYRLSDLSNAEKELLKICLADADGDESTKAMTEVYNWDYGTVINPHLIKLQDATQYNIPWFVGPEGGQELDNNMYIIPKTKLCTTQAGNQARFGSDGTVGFCANLNPPPFYALLYFSGGEFILMTNAGADYTTATEFFIYTTTGTVRRVSPMSAAFTTIDGANLGADFNTKANAASYFDNVVRFTNVSNAHKNYFGDISCETNPTGANSAIDCVNKNDLVFILHDSDFTLNPKYPNMYTVKKIANEDKTYQGVFPKPTTLPMRLQMTLDYSLNGGFHLGPSANPSVLSAANGARVYKFYPPTGYRHTGACSTRGVCNTDSGVCECFNGYTGDNCASINALAH